MCNNSSTQARHGWQQGMVLYPPTILLLSFRLTFPSVQLKVTLTSLLYAATTFLQYTYPFFANAYHFFLVSYCHCHIHNISTKNIYSHTYTWCKLIPRLFPLHDRKLHGLNIACNYACSDGGPGNECSWCTSYVA